MRLDDYAEAPAADGRVIVRAESKGLSVWTAYSGHNLDGNMAWFLFWRGRIVVKNPDKEIIAKMKEIAIKLRAHVMGDDGEEYH